MDRFEDGATINLLVMELVEGEDLSKYNAAGAPEELFETDMFPLMFDLCPDGRFLLIRFKQVIPTVYGIDVALGWNQSLSQLVPR